MPKMLDMIEKFLSGELLQPSVARLIGFRLTSIKKGEAIIEFESSKRHTNPMGTLHGGILRDITDAAMGLAYASTLEEGESFTTLELKLNFLKPVWKARLKAIGKVSKKGEPSALLDAM